MTLEKRVIHLMTQGCRGGTEDGIVRTWRHAMKRISALIIVDLRKDHYSSKGTSWR